MELNFKNLNWYQLLFIVLALIILAIAQLPSAIAYLFTFGIGVWFGIIACKWYASNTLPPTNPPKT